MVEETVQELCLGLSTCSFQGLADGKGSVRYRYGPLPSPALTSRPGAVTSHDLRQKFHVNLLFHLSPPKISKLPTLNSLMILRFQSREGQFRLTVESNTEIPSIISDVLEKLPADTVASSVTISPKPHGADSRSIESLQGVTFGRLGLTHGTQVFLDFKQDAPISNGQSVPANRLNGKEVAAEENAPSVALPSGADTRGRITNPWQTVVQSPLDDRLDALDGKIHRPKDAKMCRHGPKGMCDYCMPLEPYDKSYLAERKIKHLSYHSYLRKLNQGKNKYESGSSYMPPLSELYYRVRPDCPSGHAPFPKGICTKCQPSAITLQPQEFRMVDHVEFADAQIVDRFLDYWRRSGGQRVGYLYGRYEQYDEVPLGTKAVVEVIYEPPQVDEIDGATLTDWDTEFSVGELASLCGMQRVGVIFTDLLRPDGDAPGTAVCKRHADSFFLSSLEVVFAARHQAQHPRPSKWSDTGAFGSNFVTCVVSGDEAGQIAISAYQATNSAVEMQRADLIESSAEPSVMLVRDSDDADAANDLATTASARYVPDVFYRRINEHGANVQENARPAFPVDYLLVTLTHGFPNPPRAVFAPPRFAVENRQAIGETQEPRDLLAQLSAGGDAGVTLDSPAGMAAVADFHLLGFVHAMGVLSKVRLSSFSFSPSSSAIRAESLSFFLAHCHPRPLIVLLSHLLGITITTREYR